MEAMLTSEDSYNSRTSWWFEQVVALKQARKHAQVTEREYNDVYLDLINPTVLNIVIGNIDQSTYSSTIVALLDKYLNS